MMGIHGGEDEMGEHQVIVAGSFMGIIGESTRGAEELTTNENDGGTPRSSNLFWCRCNVQRKNCGRGQTNQQRKMKRRRKLESRPHNREKGEADGGGHQQSLFMSPWGS